MRAFLDTVQPLMLHLTEVLVVARGFIRPPDVRARHLLQDWAAGFALRWQGRGISVNVVTHDRVHVRRCILQGELEAAELRLEWGISNHICPVGIGDGDELPADVQVLLHSGVLDAAALLPSPLRHAVDGPPRAWTDRAAASTVSGTAAALRLQVAFRRRAARGLIWCDRCGEHTCARGAYASGQRDHLVALAFGGYPTVVAYETGFLQHLQCAECALSRLGRGHFRWDFLPCSASHRGRVIGRGGAVLELVQAATRAAILIPARGENGRIRIYGAR